MSDSWRERALAALSAERIARHPTPLRRYPLPLDWPVSLYVKDETTQPTGSLKHPFARDLIADAIEAGKVGATTRLIEASSGNMAVASAYFALLLGLPFTAVVPHTTGAAKLARIEKYGGTPHRVDPPLAVYERAAELASETGGHYLDHLGTIADSVDARLADRDHGLAPAILAGLPEGTPPEWIVVGVGSGACSRAVGGYLRRHGYPTKVAVVDPEHSAYFPGWATGCADYATGMPTRIEGIGRPRMEPAFDPAVVDLVIPVPDAASVAAMRHLAATAGLRAGPSTGAAFWGSCHLLHRMRQYGTRGSVVMVAADAADAYTGTYYDDAWTMAKGWDLATPAAALSRFPRTGAWPDQG
ncbi:cysteine synthase [Prauserella marina]|uniref:Cysteine synthase A n=1 Tax=Prauserella marina TaxID=530584 RepID=A0A222VRI1_9PSEU|nr:pyridoxal-phosphate dependent enzyme [Prauserella marina]ASR36527.1 cysteine synthase [Prauserella marina]PWV73921.1 cysteine synthase A [Prauserella marina]SDD58964.1 cysteine synthase A [Prauserella marina]